uniref:Transmembrane protein 176B n=1 Tax=Elaeophora elaphi TaxID=1147741 RepID=A0A158Q8Q8_9BILA
MELLKALEDPTLRIVSETDEDVLLEEGKSRMRRYKAYTVMQKSGFQHTDYLSIMINLCRVEIVVSLGFLIHGFTCPGFAQEPAYQGTCHMNVVAAVVGATTGCIGLGVVHRYRWKMMLIMWLVLCIISAVGDLLSVITTGIWLDHLSKMKSRTGLVNGLSGMMLLCSVAIGVCFILNAVMICHFWNFNSQKYQAVGKISKRPRSLIRRTSRTSSGTERKARSEKFAKGYHIV